MEEFITDVHGKVDIVFIIWVQELFWKMLKLKEIVERRNILPLWFL